MAVHPGVSIRSLHHTFASPTSVALRHRGLTRRKRAAPGTTARMATDGGCGRRGVTGTHNTSGNTTGNGNHGNRSSTGSHSSSGSGIGRGGGNGNGNFNGSNIRVGNRISSSNAALAADTASRGAGLSAFSENVERPPDGARDMQVDGDDNDDDDVGGGGRSGGGGGGGDGSSGGTSGGTSGGGGNSGNDLSHRTNRFFSCPAAAAADKREAPRPALGKGLGLGFGVLGLGELGLGVDVSSARGITMDAVFGTVRAKTSPATSASACAAASTATATAAPAAAPAPAPARQPESAGSMPSMVDLAAAVHEASGQNSAVTSSPVKPEFVEVTMELRGAEPEVGAGGGMGVEVEREYRATSSASLLLTGGGAGGSQGPTKRAKSGVTRLPAGMVLAAGRQEPSRSTAAAADTTLLGAGAAEAGVAAETADAVASRRGPGGSTRGAVGSTGERLGTAVDGAEVAAAEAPSTNEEWLALLTPLLGTVPAGTHPEDFLHEILRERGYTVELVSMKETEFHKVPEPEQVSAYDKAILNAVLDEDEAALERMRLSGRRMDACNRFGDSVLHMACRRGRAGALRYLLRVCGRGGVVLSDDFGRTLMHDACWTATPRFDVASAVLDADSRLLRMLDSRGSSPLQYVPQDQWPLWCAFFEIRKEVYWPSLAPGQKDAAGVIPRRRSSGSSSSSDVSGAGGSSTAAAAAGADALA